MSVRQIDSNIIATAFDNTFIFNSISKQFDSELLAALDLQASLCFEEVTEFIDALEDFANYDANTSTKSKAELVAEMAKEAIDLKVVSDGLLQKLQASGLIDMNEALLQVAENNLSKFPTKVDYNWCTSKGWEPVWNEDHGRFVLKDSNGKTMKPFDYKKVSLIPLVKDLT